MTDPAGRSLYVGRATPELGLGRDRLPLRPRLFRCSNLSGAFKVRACEGDRGHAACSDAVLLRHGRADPAR